jgi:demethylmenaquinone methyltransferase/2-methoxy-6-polyprenyl-1,4-benzoquinol methylase
MYLMFDHFGLLAPVYEVFIKSHPPEKLIDILDLPISGPLLDVGGGTGRVSQFLVNKVNGLFIADLSHKMLLESKSKGGLIPTCSHSEKIPFPTSFFERIIMIDALHHVCDQQETANELWRVLKPGGCIVIEEPNINHWGVKLVAAAEKIALMRSHFLKPESISELFQQQNGKTEIILDDHISWVVIEK